MAAGPAGRETRRRREPVLDWNTCWSNSLKEMAALLPVSQPRLTKKETLVHMLRYFAFLQEKIQSLQELLPPHCLPLDDSGSGSESEENAPSEPCTPPQTLNAKRKYASSRGRYRLTPNTGWSEPQVSHEEGSALDSDSVPSSMDSALSVSPMTRPLTTLLEGTSAVLWSPPGCSVCEDPGSESSPGSVAFRSPAGPRSLLLKDRMFGGVVPAGGRRKAPPNPTATPSRSGLPPLLGTGETPNLNLSPSLLSSPARGLSHALLPEGQEELQALFEDVWVTPKISTTKVSCRPWYEPYDPLSEEEKAALPLGGGGWLFSQSEEGEEEGGDLTWTPQLNPPLKKTRTRQPSRRAPPASGAQRCAAPNLKKSLKKKCVNGFIMFCRVNRKTYLHTHPGTPSTVVTKELASLWHVMPKQERRIYCLKAHRFSRQHNRNVRSEGAGLGEGEESEEGVPSPLHMLLAHRDLCTRGTP